MNRKKYPVTNIGTALILTVFIILALVTFAVLSLLNTSHDYQFTKKIADRTSLYYEASNDASELLAQIDETAKNCYTADRAQYYSNLKKELEQMNEVTLQITDERFLVSYQTPIGDDQALEVEVSLLFPSEMDDSFYTIHRWQEVSTEEWTGDTQLNLLN